MTQNITFRFILFIVFLSLAGCMVSGPDLILVIPDDYRAGLTYVIVLDSDEGREPEISPDGSLIFRYSESGQMYSSFEPFRRWHKITLMTESGEIIELESAAMWPEILSGRLANEAVIATDNFASSSKCDSDQCSISVSGDDDGALMRLRILPIE